MKGKDRKLRYRITVGNPTLDSTTWKGFSEELKFGLRTWRLKGASHKKNREKSVPGGGQGPCRGSEAGKSWCAEEMK